MIKWRKMSFDEIQVKWREFIVSRQKGKNGPYITCLERESLIDDLIERLKWEEWVTKGYEHFLEAIKEKPHG